MEYETLLTNYLSWLSGEYNREDIKAEILEFKNDGGDPEEFEKMIVTETKGRYKKNVAVEDFRKYYNDYTPIPKSRVEYGTGHMKDFRRDF
jgi:hypothetical protein